MLDDQHKPVADLLIPTDSPEMVKREYAEYVSAVETLNAARAELLATEDAIFEAEQADVQEIKSAIGAGTTVTDQHAHARKARETRDDLATRVTACEQLVHERGDALLESIDSSKAEWLEQLEASLVIAAREYHDAIETVRESMRAIGSSRYTTAWLERFSAHKLSLGGAPPGIARTLRYREPYDHEIKLAAPNSAIFDESVDALPMLDTLATLVDATPTTAAA
jgi:hypothetical protein